MFGETPFDISRREGRQPKLVTFVQGLDTLLGGGLPLGLISEFYGVPGVGRTQLMLQLAANTHIPAALGGLAGESLFIDTEGAFSADRLGEIADALGAHLAASGDHSVTRETVLSGTHVLQPAGGHIGLLAAVRALPRLLDRLPRVRFVAIDSVSFPFEHSLEDMGLRTRLLCSLSQALLAVARARNIAVAITNAVTTRVDSSLGSSHLVPALGDSFGHSCSFRVRLFWTNDVRFATLDKSHLPSPPPDSLRIVPFTVVAGGVRAADVRS